MAKIALALPNNWTPRDYQQSMWDYLENGGKRAVACWHRRAGKDDVALHWTACAAMQRPATYWHMLPEASQARKAIWEAINPHSGKQRIDEAFPLHIRSVTRSNEMFIKFINGSTWQVVGSDNFDSLVGTPPAGIVFSEWALADPRAWGMLNPILLENGGWSLFIFTPRGRNHGQKMLKHAEGNPDWFAQVLTNDDTGRFSDEQLAEARSDLIDIHGYEFGDSLYRQEYFCSFDAAILGSYYGREIEKAEADERIGDVPYDIGRECITAWDIGIGDSTAIWVCQVVGQRINVIDYIEGSGVGADWYARELRAKPYVYREHYLPHDVEVKEWGTGLGRQETLNSLGVRPIRVVPRLSIDDGINAVRRLLPRMWFDAKRCDRGIEALRQYRRDWSDENQSFRDRPRHDWSSHAADSARYLALGLGEAGMVEKVKVVDRYRKPPARNSAWTV